MPDLTLKTVYFARALYICTVKLLLSELIGTASHLDMQKIRIIGFFFENRLHWQFEVEKKILQTAVLGYIIIYIEIKHYSGDNRQVSPLRRTLEIPCLIWEPFGCYYLQCVPASTPLDHA